MEKKVSMDIKAIYAMVAFVAMLISSNLSYWIVTAVLEKLPANVFITLFGLLVMTALHVVISWGITSVFLFIKFPALYHRSEDKNIWTKKTKSLMNSTKRKKTNAPTVLVILKRAINSARIADIN